MNNFAFFLGESLIWIMVIVTFIFLFMGHRKIMAGALISGVLAWFVGKFVKDFWFQPRPVGAILQDGSFPSNHASLAFGIAFFVYLKNKKLGILFLAMALFVGLGRIMVGVHFATDVVGGAILGIVTSWLIDNYHSK
jgi:undecaprenyl-diphosphatase